MKLLSVKDNGGHFLDANGNYKPIDKIAKEDLLQFVNWTLHEDAVEFDDYDEQSIKNHAHQIIYKSVHQKLRALDASALRCNNRRLTPRTEAFTDDWRNSCSA